MKLYISAGEDGYLVAASPMPIYPGLPEPFDVPDDFVQERTSCYRLEDGKVVFDADRAATLDAADAEAERLETQEWRRQRVALDRADLVFVVLAQFDQIDDVTIMEHADAFVEWDEHWRGKRGGIVRDEGKLFRSIHDVNDAGQNTKPSATPAMWTPIGDPGDEWPPWSQPLGAHDAYAKGDKVAHSGKHWISDVDGNVWQPGAYGWAIVA